MMDRDVGDVQDGDYQIAYYYLAKAMELGTNLTPEPNFICNRENKGAMKCTEQCGWCEGYN
jgi:hypothetical protein